jgi:dihydrofolate synthase/folylpolyglutamate synthase
LLEWFEDIRPLLDEVDASFFEAATALAFTAFQRAEVDIAVIEVGLGGRLDASNIIEPLGSIITGVDLEHTRILGDTVEKIAAEKGGIIKRHPVVSGVRQEGARRVLSEIAESRGATLTFVDEDASWTYENGDLHLGSFSVTPGLKGRHQAENAALALTLLDILHEGGVLHIPDSAREIGVSGVCWPGRYDRQRTSAGAVIFDVAHNPSGARVLAEELIRDVRRPIPAVVGMLRDKPHLPVLEALRPAVSALWVTTPDSERRLEAAELADHARAAGYETIHVEPDPARAAIAAATHDTPIVVTGSLFTVGAAMDGLGLVPADQPGGLGTLVGSGS